MFECLVGAISAGAITGVLGHMRKNGFRKYASNEELLMELSKRGFNVEDFALETYLRKTFETLQPLGAGQSGQVWKVRKMRTGEILAMKRIRKQQRNGKYVADEALETELSCLRKLSHPNIVNIVETVESTANLWIIMEYAAGGELYRRITELSHFSERSAARIVKQVLKAVHYMHSYGVVHRDLKLENILLTSSAEDAIIKVADFGLAYILKHGFESYRPDESMRMKKATCIRESFCGSPICMAPEVAKHNAAYGPQCDMWSVGCITFELLSGHPPFQAATASDLFKIVHASAGPDFLDWVWLGISDEAKDIVAKLIKKRPEDRLSAREALHHSWFRTAPDVHMAEAHSAIVRRFTSEATAATTVRRLTSEATTIRASRITLPCVSVSRESHGNQDVNETTATMAKLMTPPCIFEEIRESHGSQEVNETTATMPIFTTAPCMFEDIRESHGNQEVNETTATMPIFTTTPCMFEEIRESHGSQEVNETNAAIARFTTRPCIFEEIPDEADAQCLTLG
jgi:serine/threonine protein kinase